MRLVYVLPVLMLTACGFESPTWMPSGYSYANSEYKAQPGPEAAPIGYPYSAARNDYVNSMWTDTARALLNDLESQTGLSAQPIFVADLENKNAFNMSFDNALREELRARGYTLAPEAAGNVELKYQAFKAEDENKRPAYPYNDDEGNKESLKPYKPENAEPYVFVMTLFKDNVAFGEVRKTQVMPGFGYVAREGNILPAPRVDGRTAPVNETKALDPWSR